MTTRMSIGCPSINMNYLMINPLEENRLASVFLFVFGLFLCARIEPPRSGRLVLFTFLRILREFEDEQT